MIPKEASICPHCRKKQGLNLLSKLFLIFVGLLILGFIIKEEGRDKPDLQLEKNQKVIEKPSILPDIHVRDIDFINDYKEHYKGRNIVITGMIAGIFIPPPSVQMKMAEKGLAANAFIYFSDKPVFDVEETLMGNGVSCYLGESLATKAHMLRIGQAITLRCKCGDARVLEDCTLAETSSHEQTDTNEQGSELISLHNIKQRFIDNPKINSFLVIEGEVKNNYQEDRKKILISGSVKTAENQGTMSHKVYAGWTFTTNELETLSFEELNRLKKLQTERFSPNIKVPPGNTIPFMILFPSFPLGSHQVSIKVLSSQKIEHFPSEEKKNNSAMLGDSKKIRNDRINQFFPSPV